MENKTAVIDRIEEGVATVIPDDGTPLFTLHLPDGFFEGQTVILTDEGIRPAKEDEIPPRNSKERLRNLFNKSKQEKS